MLKYTIDTRDKDFNKLKSAMDSLLRDERANKRPCQFATREQYVFDSSAAVRYTEYMYTFQDLVTSETTSTRVAPQIASVTKPSIITSTAATIAPSSQTAPGATVGVAPTINVVSQLNTANPTGVFNDYIINGINYKLQYDGKLIKVLPNATSVTFSIPADFLSYTTSQLNQLRADLIVALGGVRDVQANSVLADYATFRGARFGWTTLDASFVYGDDDYPNPNNPYNLSNRQYREVQAANILL